MQYDYECQFDETNKKVFYIIRIPLQYIWLANQIQHCSDRQKRKLFFLLLFILSICIDLTNKFVLETCVYVTTREM